MIKDKPDVPPSSVAAAETSTEESFSDSFGVMWANKNFMVLALSYAIYYGCSCALGATMSNLFSAFGYTVIQISKIGFLCMLSGVIAALLFGIVLDYTEQYRKSHIFLTICGVLSGLMVAAAL